MEFIEFKSAREIEKSRNELREARNEMLEKAKLDAEYRLQRKEKARERGEGTWMLPEVLEKIEKSSKTKHKSKKHKKEKKKKQKKEKNRKSSSDSDSEDEPKTNEKKKKKKKKNKHKHRSSSSDSDSDDDEPKHDIVSKDLLAKKDIPINDTKRDDWMTLSGSFSTFTKSDLRKDREKEKEEKKNADIYVPGKCSRELNPYWKDGGDGLPSSNIKLNFRKPDESPVNSRQNTLNSRQGNWRKKKDQESSISKKDKSLSPKVEPSESSSSSSEEDVPVQSKTQVFLTDQQMNELAAKLVKAEILGNQSLIVELKQKLEDAREFRKNKSQTPLPQNDSKPSDEDVLLTSTDSRGITRPLTKSSAQDDPYYGKKRKNKKTKVQTHTDGKRTKYFADDDRHTLRDMFESERLSTTDDQNKQFADIVARHTNPNDEMEDIFAEKIRSKDSDSKLDEKAKNRAIREHEKLSQTLDNCDKCLDSKKMEKHLIVAMGEYSYLCLLATEGMTKGHCCIVPMRHVSCSTLLDEEVWREMQEFRKALTKMFRSRSMDIVFFETAIYLNRRPHMVVQCIPGPSEQMELVPFYFKKAIQECEGEWSHNKKLIELKGRELIRAVPKGLPYFWVDFGDGTGFAHVIEEQDRFPKHFAQEIIGGMLELEPRVWRQPKKQHLVIQKVTEFAEWWKPFDITIK